MYCCAVTSFQTKIVGVHYTQGSLIHGNIQLDGQQYQIYLQRFFVTCYWLTFGETSDFQLKRKNLKFLAGFQFEETLMLISAWLLPPLAPTAVSGIFFCPKLIFTFL